MTLGARGSRRIQSLLATADLASGHRLRGSYLTAQAPRIRNVIARIVSGILLLFSGSRRVIRVVPE